MGPVAIAVPARRSANPYCDALLEGLSRSPKRIPAKFFYDTPGSALFERITALPEYYPARTEIWILEEQARQFLVLAHEFSHIILNLKTGVHNRPVMRSSDE